MTAKSTILAIAAISGLLSSPAWATFKVNINGTVITDGGVGDLAPLAPDKIIYDVAGLVFEFDGSASGSTSNFGTLTINSTGTHILVPGTYTLSVTQDSLTAPVGPVLMVQRLTGNTPSGGIVGTISAQGYYSASNTLFDTSGPSTPVATTNTFGTATSTSSVVTFASPFALTDVITLNLTSKGTSSDPDTADKVQITANLTAGNVPEPTSVALLLGIVGCSAAALRRKLQIKS